MDVIRIKSIISDRSGINSKLKQLHLYSYVIELTKFLNENYKTVLLSQRLWHISNDNYILQYCHICKINLAKFYQRNQNYITCSKLCENKQRKETNKEKYGTEFSVQGDSQKLKTIKTNKEKYGTEFYLQSDDYKKKVLKTNMEKFGTDNPSKSSMVKSKLSKTVNERYGVKSYFKSAEIKNHQKIYYKSKLIEKLNKDEYVVIDYEFKSSVINHIKCDNNFVISNKLLSLRRSSKSELCLICNPINKPISIGEKEVLSFVKTVYDGIIFENSRKIISPYELDIYLPDLKIAIEYNGKYWHSTRPEGYHKMKTDKCIQKGIQLVTIWDYEWKDNRNAICDSLVDLFRKPMIINS